MVGVVASIGYFANLGGSPAIGLLPERVGLLNSLRLIVVLMVAASAVPGCCVLCTAEAPSVTDTLKEFADVVAAEEPGNLAFEVYRSAQHDDEIVLLERYRSREAFAEHRSSRHFREYILDIVIPQLRERIVELIDVGDSRG